MSGPGHRTHDTEPQVGASGGGWTSQIDPELTDRVAPGTRPILDNGTLVDRYVILAHLGSGGMGAVYAAWDQKLARRVALKLLHRDRRRAEDNAWRLQREARVLARLDHEHVVRVFDVGTWQGAPYITMELVDGASLDVSLAERRLSPHEIVTAFIAAGRGLAAAHRLGVVHRDVKAQNIFVGADGRARIGDFGIAIVVDDAEGDPSQSSSLTPVSVGDDVTEAEGSTVEGAVLGTPAYMAPEHLEGRRVDARADVFSFCVALWRAVFDDDPFAAPANTLARLERIKVGPQRPKRRDAALEAVLARGLRFSAKKRTPSMDVLLRELEWLSKRGQRRRLAVVVVAVLALIAVSAVAVARRDPCGVRAASESLNETLQATTRSPALEAVLRRWDARWAQSAAGTCGRADLSDEVRDARLRCYVAIHADAAALLSLKARDIINDDAALQAGLSLPLPERCLDGRVPVSTDEQLIAALALARMGLLAGDTRRAAAEAQSVVDRADDGDNDVIVAEAAVVLSKAHTLMGELPKAEAITMRGLGAAMRSQSPRVEAELWMALVDIIGDKIKRHDDVKRLAPLMRAAVARFPDDLDIKAQALITEALLANEFGDKRSGAQRAAEAFAIAKQRDPIDPHLIADAVNLQSLMLAMLGETRRAVFVIEQGRALMLRDLPPTHLRFLAMNNSLGLAAMRDHDLVSARRAFEASIAVAAAQAQPRDFDAIRGVPLINLGKVELMEGNVDKAIAIATDARAILVGSVGEDNARVAYADELLAFAAAAVGDFAAAEVHARRMLARTAATPGVWLDVRAAILVASIRAEVTGDLGAARAHITALRPENAQGRASQEAAILALLVAEGGLDAARQVLPTVLQEDAMAGLAVDERHLVEAIRDALSKAKPKAPFPTHVPLARLAARGVGATP